MKNTTKHQRSWLGLAFLLLAAACLPGCAQHNLFADDDPAAQKKKYWDDESVRQSHANHEQTRGAGFGFSNGPSAQ